MTPGGGGGTGRGAVAPSAAGCHLQELSESQPSAWPREINSRQPLRGSSDHSQSAFYCQSDPNTRKLNSTPRTGSLCSPRHSGY